MAKLSIERQLDKIPNTSGIYKFIDKSGKLLYVGKANNLRTRVRSYFTQIHDDRPHIIPMIEQIEKIEVTETENEIEALVLESALIKENQPHYNIMLKDDKSYAWIYINTRDELPTVSILRSINLKDYKRVDYLDHTQIVELPDRYSDIFVRSILSVHVILRVNRVCIIE